MEYRQADIDDKYDFIAHEGLVITVKCTGFNRFDGLLSLIDTIIGSPFEDHGVHIIPSPWHYQHFNSPFGDFESRKEYLQEKIKWIELESFESLYQGKKYHSYQ